MKLKSTISTSVLMLLAILSCFSIQAQEEREHSTYYYQKASHFSTLPAPEGVVFLGNSITDGAEWHTLFPNIEIANRGISGDVSQGILDRLDGVIQGKPNKLFLMIGINDLAAGVSKDELVANILEIVARVRQHSPYTSVYVQSMLPVNNTFRKFAYHLAKKKMVPKVNADLMELAAENGYTFVNLYPEFLNEKGQLDEQYTNDGLHLTGEGYLLWKHLVFPYVYDLSEKPSLIPAPTNVQWEKGKFPWYKTKAISISEPSLKPLAEKLRIHFTGNNPPIISEKNKIPKGERILIDLVNDTTYGKEGYKLKVDPKEIQLTANTPNGIFYGLQTLFQLLQDHTFVPACTIYDKPAFSWRGLMHDLGRNYIPIKELKEHINLMAKYKMNKLHLHLTEDIAWRLGIPEYPELTAASNMNRNRGMYYTMKELKKLIEYSKERYITVVPEIDMPGHSAAFHRAFGVKMQSEQGKDILKNILHKVAGELDVPYFHLGGDEVAITDTTFLPEMSKIIREYDKEVIGWLPGGNLDNRAIRQLWASPTIPEAEMPLIDSRHLYLNHIDPLGGIVKTFNRQILEVEKGNNLLLGGEICVWPDRRPSGIAQTMQMNAVYPAMLTFAERIWKGGGFPKYGVTLGEEGSEQLQAFREFETRLLDHKKQFFVGEYFPYVKQGMARWQIAGPYGNQGNLAAIFEPETQTNFWEKGNFKQVIGSTVWLRHFFAPYMEGKSGYVQDPKENSTSYAFTKIYVPTDKKVKMWISFHNPSRSETDATAPAGEWDYKKSQIWLNGKEIAPPDWSKPGRKGEKEAPYIDESFEIRPPHTVSLKKGWNKLLLKLPVGQFSTPQTRLVKWMFTVSFIEKVNGQWRNASGIEYMR